MKYSKAAESCYNFRMPAILLYLLGLLVIFYLLAKVCDQYFVKSLDIIAQKLQLSEDVAGATFMAIGSSAPEFFTALFALTKVGAEDVGAGTIVGSAIFNILVIVGASAVVATAYLDWRPVVRDMGFYIISILALMFTFLDGRITMWEALSYLIAYAVYIVVLARWRYWFPGAKTEEQLGAIAEAFEKKEAEAEARTLIGKILAPLDWLIALPFPNLQKNPKLYVRAFAISILAIILLSYLLVELGIGLAHALGIPEVIIALTILAGGTSIPDLLSSVIVAKQGRGDMAVSNAVGSNTFDILICLGLPWFVFILWRGEDIIVATESLTSSVFLLFSTVVVMFLVLGIQKFKIGRYSGYFLLLLYAGYLSYAIYGAYHPEAMDIEVLRKAIGF